jgi:hypothetical protein
MNTHPHIRLAIAAEQLLIAFGAADAGRRARDGKREAGAGARPHRTRRAARRPYSPANVYGPCQTGGWVSGACCRWP